MSTFVIVEPGGWGHVSDNPHAHLVVDVEEWVQVHHKEKAAYDFISEHGTYDAAQAERNRLNSRRADPPEQSQVEVAVEIPGEGVQWLGAKAS